MRPLGGGAGEPAAAARKVERALDTNRTVKEAVV